MPLEPGQFAQFGSFVFDPKQRVLTSNGEVVPLAPKDIELLRVLLDNAGQIVEKKEILDKVWPDTFVEEANLSRHIFNLRQILSEDGQRSIQTIPKRGYRLVLPVNFVASPTQSSVKLLALNSDATEEVKPSSDAASPPKKNKDPAHSFVRAAVSRWWVWTAGILIFLSVGAMIDFKGAMGTNRPSLAVLPVQNLTGDPSKDYICDGLTEELISRIGGVDSNGLDVIPRTSSMAYKTNGRTAGQIAKDLNAQYLLEASLRQSGGRFRVTAKLIRLPDQRYIWIREFDQTTADSITMEDEVSNAVADLLMDLPSSKPANGAAPR